MLTAAAASQPLAARLASGRARLPSPPSLGRRRRSLPPPTLAAAGRPGEDSIPDVSDILRKYSADGSSGSGSSRNGSLAPRPPAQRPQQANGGMGNGLFAILALNFGLFAGSNLLHLPALGALALNHMQPHWWQFVTATFMHANWQHLSSNAFALLLFGQKVEEEEGALGLWATYLLAGVGGTLASYLTSPHTYAVSLGASGAVFGLFIVALIAKFKPNLKCLLELTILGQFVVQQVAGEVQQVAAGKAATIGGLQVGHVAHLAGAAAGVVLVALLSRLPDPAE